MRIINVITTNDTNGLVNIDSFGIIDEQDSSTVVEQAEECFTETIVAVRHEDTSTEDADELREEVVENWIGEGYYEVGDDVNTQIFLSWSTIDNIQL